MERLVIAAVGLHAIPAYVHLRLVDGRFLRVPSIPAPWGCGSAGNGNRKNCADGSGLHREM